MSYKIVLTSNFVKESKKLAKKYNSLKVELKILGDQLIKNPQTGTSLGNGVYKIRLAIASKGKGKSGGARIITYIKITREIIFMVSIYDKKRQDNLTKDQISELLKKAGLA